MSKLESYIITILALLVGAFGGDTLGKRNADRWHAKHPSVNVVYEILHDGQGASVTCTLDPRSYPSIGDGACPPGSTCSWTGTSQSPSGLDSGITTCNQYGDCLPCPPAWSCTPFR